MAKYCGKDLLLQMGNGASPEVFTTIGAMKSNSLTINNEKVDVTTKDDMAWH
jgi:predicted secreted protein